MTTLELSHSTSIVSCESDDSLVMTASRVEGDPTVLTLCTHPEQKQRSLIHPAMATTSPATSNIARALTAMAESTDVPKPNRANFWAGRDSFATVAARSAPDAQSASGLPTPPNSISPILPPQGFRSGVVAAGPPTPPAAGHEDSDIDLQDAVDHANSQGAAHATVHGDANSDAVGNITPTMLAQHHLPGILLEHAPLAIRYIMGYLNQQVPGFSGIPPARARRLVVAALEGRSEDGEQGSLNKDIVFEKVGWGRWDARRVGQPRRESHTISAMTVNKSHSPALTGLQIPGQRAGPKRRRDTVGTSIGEDSLFSHPSDHGYDTPMDDVSTLDHDIDKVSIDKSRSNRSSELPDPFHDDPFILEGDSTDLEDWESIGAEALRQGSYTSSTMTTRPSRPTVKQSSSYSSSRPFHNQQHDRGSRGRGGPLPANKTISKSVPHHRTAMYHNFPFSKERSGSQARKHLQHHLQRRLAGDTVSDVKDRGSTDPEARAAVEALLALGGGLGGVNM